MVGLVQITILLAFYCIFHYFVQDDDEDDDNEEEGGLSKSGKELKKLLGRLDESDTEDDDDNDNDNVGYLLWGV